MRTGRRTPCPRLRVGCEVWKRVLAAVLLLAGFLLCFYMWRAPAYAAPYVSCPGGYIAPVLKDCPPVAKHPVGGPSGSGGPRGGGGTTSNGGVLGNLLDHIGLGGLGGIL